jgi:hypothetical protein
MIRLNPSHPPHPLIPAPIPTIPVKQMEPPYRIDSSRMGGFRRSINGGHRLFLGLMAPVVLLSLKDLVE